MLPSRPMARGRRTDLAIMLAIVALGSAVTILWGERIGIYQGEGWDGQAYAAWARDFPKAILDKGVTTFQSDRVLPSAVLYYTLDAISAAHSRAHVIVAFQLLNVLALLASVGFLVRIAVILEWSRPALWAAFVATFLSFASAREALYYPTMTDATAFALGMGTVWAYLGRRPIAQWAIAFASAFTWPALVASSFAALILPRATTALPVTTGRWHRPVAIGIGVAAGGFIIAWFLYVLATPTGVERWLDRAHHDLYPLTIGLVVITTALAAYVVARQDLTWSVWPYVRQIGWLRIALALAAAAAILVVRGLWNDRVSTQGPGFTWRELRHYYAANAVRGPLWNTVHQVVYFGPIVLVAIAAWPRIARVAARWGPAAILTLGMIVVTAVSADARHLLHLMPFAIAITITATAELWTPRRVLVLAALYLVWSKIWLKIGYVIVHDSLKWPDLRFFMHHGPWASDETWLAHLAGVVVTAVVLWLVLRRSPRGSPGQITRRAD
ncbi:MAG: hypothetical protein H6Q90_5224 [Deltaproteobacteria bacterium]|nr:hypothetical protein [Deltaproteobacteria bacterium]